MQLKCRYLCCRAVGVHAASAPRANRGRIPPQLQAGGPASRRRPLPGYARATAARPSPATAHSLPADPAASALAPVAVVGPPRRPNGTAAELAADVHWRGPRAQGCRLAKRRLGDVNNIGILRISDDRQAAMLIAVRFTQMGWDMSQAQLLRRRATMTFRFERVTW